MTGHPVEEVKGSKPRFRPKGKMDELDRAEISKLSRDYLENRNAQMRSKNATAEIDLAQRRGELIEKRLVETQAAYLLVALRQRILGVPQAYARRMLGLTEAKQSAKILRDAMIELLNDLKDLPLKVANPHWLEGLEAEGNGDTSKPASVRRKRKRQ